MTDRVYPSTKQNGTTTNATTTAVPPPQIHPPPNKSHLYNPNNPRRQIPVARRRQKRSLTCRRCFCLTCFWLILLLIALLLLAAIAGAAFYALYHPHRPEFSVAAVKFTAFNLTTTAPDDSIHLTTKLNLTVSVKNPNKKIEYRYDPMSIAVVSSSITLCNATFANFTSSPESVFTIHTVAGPKSQVLTAEDVGNLRRRRNGGGVAVEIVVDTNVGIKMEKVKVRKVGIRVKCGGIRVILPTATRGKMVNPVVANVAKAKCEVDLRIKIWKLTF